VGSLAGELWNIEATFMRKLINTLVAGLILCGFSVSMPGCTEETGTKEETKITSPTGTATETRQIKVDKTGENPPKAPSEKPKP
jgi:hypothetical protein